ncbi:amino acid permease, partial [Arthrospira platensis SPKY1]|nr:amino acid permease [Arthrospira platensis SPKY1]
ENAVIKNIIIYGAVISMFGINIAAAFGTPRIFEAMAEEGQLPAMLSKKTQKGVPLFAFIVTAAMAIVVPMAFQYDMRGIMIISSVSRFIQFLVVPIAVILFFYDKNKQPKIETAKKVFFTDVIIPI